MNYVCAFCKCLFNIGWRAVLLVGLTTPTATGQAFANADSLARVLKRQAAAGLSRDTSYAITMGDYAYALVYQAQQYRAGDSVGRRAETLSRQLNFGNGVSRALVAQGAAQIQLNNIEAAAALFRRLVADATHYQLPKLRLLNALGNLSAVYRLQGKTKEALATVDEAIRLENRHKIRPRNENLRRTMGSLLRTANQPRQAIPYLEEGIVIAKENDGIGVLAGLEVDLGSVHSDLGNHRQAINYRLNALTHSRQAGVPSIETDALTGLASTYNDLKQPQKGLVYARQAVMLATKVGFTQNIGTSHYTLGSIYASLKDYPRAETELLKAVASAREVGNLINEELYTTGLAEIAVMRQNWKSAYTYQLKSQTLKDSLLTGQTKDQLNELNTRLGTEKKEARIRLLQKEKQLQIQVADRNQFRVNALIVGGLLLLGLGLAVSAWLLNRARLRRLQEAQQLRKQIAHDLHDDIGSTLSSISLLSGMVNTMTAQNRPDTARQMVEKIHTDARQILDAMDEIVWTINPGNDSLRPVALRLREYAQPLFDAQNIRLMVDIPPEIDTLPLPMDVRRNLYLIGKEAINNAAKYADATEVVIRFRQLAGQLQVQIEDNGRGFLADQPSLRTGQRSMQARAEAIGGRLVVASSPGQGTRVQLTTNS
jgi:two-component system, NarL family, sensor histidine kinase UhpB